MAQPAVERPILEVVETLNRSKITPPRPPAISRPELVDRLERGSAGRLTLVIAPAGWGKSSVLAEWVHQSSMDVAWLCCDEADNNPTRFLRALAAAIDRVRPDSVDDLFAMLRSSRPLSVSQILDALDERIASEPAPLAIVFDDFHLIEHPEVLIGLETLITTAPEQLHVLLASRALPPWSLARWRAHGEIVELGTGDLAFSEQHIALMLGEGIVDPEIVRALQERSEGWAAGIRLAVLWAQRGGRPEEIVDKFTGTHRDIADYLAEEVLSRLPEELSRFLLMTSVLDQFSAPLASAVTGNADAAAMIEQIEAQGIFLIPMDHERRGYRYHGLFREFLRERLRRTAPGMEAELNRRAAEWYRVEGAIVEAAEYLLRAGDAGQAALLVDQMAERLLLQQGETHTLIRLVEQLPAERMHATPSLLRFYAWGLVLTGRLAEAEALALDLERRITDAGPEQTRFQRAEIGGIRSRIAAYRGDHNATIAHATEALACTDASMDWFRADALLSLGFAHRAQGRVEVAAQCFAEASRLGWQAGLAHAACWGARYQAVIYVSQGRLHDASVLLDEALERARQTGLDHGAGYAALLVGRGELRYERNELPRARNDLDRALALAHEVGDAKILMNVYVALAMLQAADGETEQARVSIRRAIQIFNGPTEKATAAWLALKRGDLPAVRRWVEWYRVTEGSAPSLSCGEAEQVIFGRALIATGSVQEGRAFLSGLLQQAEETGRLGHAAVIHMLLALQADAERNEAEAFDHLRPVLDLAARESYLRTLLDEGPALLRLLRRFVRHDDAAPRRRHAATLLAAAGENGEDAGPLSTGGSLIEPLTERQREILRLLADGHSNREIADALYLAEGTIKAHIHQIYGKLLVRNRAEAIRAAHELGLLA